MRRNIRINKDYECNGKLYYRVKINNEYFDVATDMAKVKICFRSNCKYYNHCSWRDGVLRTFDCKKNRARLNFIWNVITSAVVMFLAITFYKTLNLGFTKGTGLMIASMVFLDIICFGIEKLSNVIRDEYFYFRLKKAKAKEEEIQKQERLAKEAKRLQEQLEADSKDPNRVKIREAENTLNQIATISKEINFGECDEKVEFCVTKCREIIEYLNKDSSGYIRVDSLLQVYLPEFYKMLALYAEFVKAEVIEEEQSKKLNETVDYFYNFLCKQKVEAIFDKKATEIKFNAAASNLKREVEMRGGKL